MQTITWLHISDIHLNKRGVETRRLRAKLIEFLKSQKITCDYVFFTGDLRFAPAGAFDAATVPFLRELCQSVNAPLERLFAVPGNHDIDRNEAGRNSAIEAIGGSGQTGYYQSREGVIYEADLEKLAAGKRDFIDVMKELYRDVPGRAALYQNAQKPHFCIKTPDFNIVHMDSTLTYSASRERDLIVGTELLMDVLEETDAEKPAILLTHYSFDSMERKEQRTLLKLLEDYNVQLWFAGHEHVELLRKQRDYFYELQCGNLLHEDEETKSCIILGQYDADNGSGEVRLYAWASPDGWTQYPFVRDQGKDRSVYPFVLQETVDRICQIKTIAASPKFREVAEGVRAFNLYDLDQSMLHNMSEENFYTVKKQLGSRLNGQESRTEIETMFLNEVKMSLNSGKRYDCMPMFGGVVRDVFPCFLYLDEEIAPFIEARVSHFFLDEVDHFQIQSDAFGIVVSTCRGEPIGLSFGYQLGYYTDVDERLYRFEQIRRYLGAKNVFVKMAGHSQYDFSYEIKTTGEEWEQMVQSTEFWYETMCRIARIEQGYKVKFHLPPRASEEDYLAIEVLSDSLEHKSCRHLPAIPMAHPGFRRRFTLEEEVHIGDGGELPLLYLFGYTFRPVAQYILPGEFRWDKREGGWKSVQEAGGVPLRVDFALSDEEERNRELIRFIPFEEVQGQFHGKEIVLLEGESAEIFQRFVQVTHDVQEIWQAYLAYQSRLERFILYEQAENGSKRLRHKETGKAIDKVTVNEVTVEIVSAGCRMIKSMDRLAEQMGFPHRENEAFSVAWTAENLGFLFLAVMTGYAKEGHFPVSVAGDGSCYYDLCAIGYESGNASNTEPDEQIVWLREECREAGLRLDRIDHYIMLRNFMYAVAQVQAEYYRLLEEKLSVLQKRVKEIINRNPELIMDRGDFSGHVVYLLKGEDVYHAFPCDSDIMVNFYRYEEEAKQYLERCRTGKGDKRN